jgi:hypothetical protein
MGKSSLDLDKLTPDDWAAIQARMAAKTAGAGDRRQTTEYRPGRDGEPNNTIWRTPDPLADLRPGSSLDRGAYDQRSTRPGAADRIVDAQTRVIREAKRRNPNTPADFDSISGVRRRSDELAAEMFSKPPTPAPLMPSPADFSQGMSGPQFWKTYAALRTGRPLPVEGAPSAAAVRSIAGTGTVGQTPWGLISSNTKAPPTDPNRGGPLQAGRAGQLREFIDDRSVRSFTDPRDASGLLSMEPPSPNAATPPSVPGSDAVSPGATAGLPPVTISPQSPMTVPQPTGTATTQPQSNAYRIGRGIGRTYGAVSNSLAQGFAKPFRGAGQQIRSQFRTNTDFLRGLFAPI